MLNYADSACLLAEFVYLVILEHNSVYKIQSACKRLPFVWEPKRSFYIFNWWLKSALYNSCNYLSLISVKEVNTLSLVSENFIQINYK